MGSSEKLAERIGMIIMKLNNGEKLDVSSLAREFDVSERTVYRDLTERLNYLPIQQKAGKFFIDVRAMGRYSYGDFIKFSNFIGLSNILPIFTPDILNRVLENSEEEYFKIEGLDKKMYFSDAIYCKLFVQAAGSIFYKKRLNVLYDSLDYKNVEPAYLYFRDSKWHLDAVCEGKDVSFVLDRITHMDEV